MNEWEEWKKKTVDTNPDLALPLRIRVMYKMFKKTEGRQCQQCEFFVRIQMGGTYFKCSKSRMSHGPATDWRARWVACGLFVEGQAETIQRNT
jgi:hypothetical protein